MSTKNLHKIPGGGMVSSMGIDWSKRPYQVKQKYPSLEALMDIFRNANPGNWDVDLCEGGGRFPCEAWPSSVCTFPADVVISKDDTSEFLCRECFTILLPQS